MEDLVSFKVENSCDQHIKHLHIIVIRFKWEVRMVKIVAFIKGFMETSLVAFKKVANMDINL